MDLTLYVVVSVCAGCLEDVSGFQSKGDAELERIRLQDELGIIPGKEDESEHDVQVREIQVEMYPTSVQVARRVW